MLKKNDKKSMLIIEELVKIAKENILMPNK